MKIGDPSDKSIAATTGRSSVSSDTTAKPSGASATASTQAEASAKVALSSQATQLLSGDKQVSGEFDSEKVERIAQAISDGKFEINAPAIADKLLANAREVLGKAQH